MNKILFVDDMLERWQSFTDRLPKDFGFVFYAADADKAIEALKDVELSWDVIMLDHDLAKVDYVQNCANRPDAECGCKIVQYVCENNKDFKDTKFIIHSWNPDGAMAMHKALERHGLQSKIMPFEAPK